jgi:hypothetical protein
LGLSDGADAQDTADELNFPAFRRILVGQTRLSAGFSVGVPAGGEMSGLIAHFLFGAKLRDARSEFSAHNPLKINRMQVASVRVPGKRP